MKACAGLSSTVLRQEEPTNESTAPKNLMERQAGPGLRVGFGRNCLTFFSYIGPMDGAGLWPLYLLQAMEPTLLVLLSQ